VNPISAALDAASRARCCPAGGCHGTARGEGPCQSGRYRADAARAIIAFLRALPEHLHPPRTLAKAVEAACDA